VLKIIKEPLLQFILIGAVLFIVYNLLNMKQVKDKIVIDSFLINELSAKYKMQWKHEPGLKELTGLIDTYVEQEVLYREALSMNLDRNDEVIKRTLAKKMEFLSDDLSESLEPTESMLRTYYETHKDNYVKPPFYSLKQVYFSTDKRSEAWKDAEKALSEKQPENSGDLLPIPMQYSNTNATKLALDFGQGFAAALDSLPIGKWTGPVKSGLGVHLVFILDKYPSGFFSFEEVANKVKVDYSFETSTAFRKELIATMLKKYTINIDVSDVELNKALHEKF
jgi:hypothetical protein